MKPCTSLGLDRIEDPDRFVNLYVLYSLEVGITRILEETWKGCRQDRVQVQVLEERSAETCDKNLDLTV
jgi:hypothetical protein